MLDRAAVEELGCLERPFVGDDDGDGDDVDVPVVVVVVVVDVVEMDAEEVIPPSATLDIWPLSCFIAGACC